MCRYNYAVAPSFWPSKAAWRDARARFLLGQPMAVADRALMFSAKVFSKQVLEPSP